MRDSVTVGVRVTVVGSGSWGTTVAAVASRRATTTLWSRRRDVADEINTERTNAAYLGEEKLPVGLVATDDLEEAVSRADVLVMAVPSHGFRDVVEAAAPHVRQRIPVVSLSKGLEKGTHLRMSEVIAEALPGHPAGVLTGPNIASEVLRGYAAAAVIAMSDERVAHDLQRLLRTPLFRIYTGTDVAGAEYGGALKNVFAIAAGMAEGLDSGDNTRGAVITRSLRELTRLGTAGGGRPETFAGLAGLGDLLTTCMSPSSRNRTVGQRLAEGETLDEIRADMRMVAEGVGTASVVMELAGVHGLTLPIAAEVHSVVQGYRTPQQAFRGLLRSMPTTEMAPG